MPYGSSDATSRPYAALANFSSTKRIIFDGGSRRVSAPTDMRQHFHNYVELLLGAERSKLQRAIANANTPSEQHEIVVEIDYRINYLRGAVRMGKLLCLIDQKEAKAHLDVLSSERDRLRAGAL